MYNPFTLENKRILITGASSGIGKQTAIECSKMGAKLIITGRNEQRIQETFNELEGEGHKQIIADLLKEEDIKYLVAETGEIEGVVLCSGKGLTVPFQFATREKFDDIFNTNFFSPMELLRLLYKKKNLQKTASVVIIASVGGTKVFNNGNSIYGATKAALNSMMKFCAKEFAPRLIRVNSVCPGMVETPFIHCGTLTEEQLNEYRQTYLLKRFGKPEDIAYLNIYLLSNASSWMTGQEIYIEGGGECYHKK